jgi:hypothetical protein
MSIEILLFIIILLLFLFFIVFISRKIILRILKNSKRKFDSESNYPSILAINVLFSGFSLILSSKSPSIINTIINAINGFIGTNIPRFRLEVDTSIIFLYSIFTFGVLYIIYTTYKNKYVKNKIDSQENKLNENTLNITDIIENISSENPDLVYRVKELFELKYKKYDLSLKEKKDENENKILYGSYQDDLNICYKIIYCDDSINSNISIEKQKATYDFLKNNIYNNLVDTTHNSSANYYYILKNGYFDNPASTSDDSNIKNYLSCMTEDEMYNSAINFNKYLSGLIYDYENSKLFSSITNDEEKKTLSQTFIEPNFYIGENKDTIYSDLKGFLDKWVLNTCENRQFLLSGDYGMGKTSFLKYYSSMLAKDILNNKSIKRFPVFIPLTNTSPMHGGILKSICTFIAKNLGVDYDLFKIIVEKGKILFILDAFDEMGFIGSYEQRFKQFSEIWQLATKNNKVIISGRPSYFPNESELKHAMQIPKLGFESIQCRPYAEKIVLSNLNEDQIYQYIEKYYPLEARKYTDWILGNNSLLDLCKRPSMMHIIREMLEKLYLDSSHTLLTASEMIHRYIEYWVNRQENKHIKSALDGRVSEKSKFIFSFFKHLSEIMHKNDKYFYNIDEIKKLIEKEISHFNFNFGKSKDLYEGLIQEILTGYFIEREDDSFKFVHKPFFDYFLSEQIIEYIQTNQSKNELLINYWRPEVTDFIFDSIPTKYKNHPKYPSLLYWTNQSKIMLSIKLFYFKIIAKYFVYITHLFNILFLSSMFFTIYSKEVLNSLSFYQLIIIILFPLLLFFIYSVKKINPFTFKTIQIAITKNEICSKYYFNLLFSSPYEIRDVIFKNLKIKFIKDFKTITNTKFINIEFIDCNISDTIYYTNCHFDNVIFKNSFFRKIIFDNCDLYNVNFNNITTRSIYYNFFSISVVTQTLITFRPKIHFKNMKDTQVNTSSITSIKKLITDNIYSFQNKSIIVDDEWLKGKIIEK